MSLYGYDPLDTSIIQPAELFLTRAGDQIINRLFTFDRYDQQYALRPEFTASSAHHYAQLDLSGIARWQFGGPVFIDTPEHSENRFQQMSVGAELIGLSGPAADAEIISLASQSIAKQGVDVRLLIGHTGLLRHLLGAFRLDSRTERFLLNHIADLQQRGKDQVLDMFGRSMTFPELESSGLKQVEAHPASTSELSTHEMVGVLLEATQYSTTMGGRTQEDIARRLFQKRRRYAEQSQVYEALEFLEEWIKISGPVEQSMAHIANFLPKDDLTAQRLFREWDETIALLHEYDIHLGSVTIQPYVTRNWDYYTGIVFELLSTSGSLLGGGGRYDELLALISGKQSVPAVGFAFYVDPILGLVQHTDMPQPRLLRIALTDTNGKQASRLAHRLRKHDISAAIVPADENGMGLIHIDQNGRISFDGANYSMTDGVDRLISAWQGMQDE